MHNRPAGIRSRCWTTARLSVAACALGLGLSAFGTPRPATAAYLEVRYEVHLGVLPFRLATGILKADVSDRGRYVVDVKGSGWGFGLSAKSLGQVNAGAISPVSAAFDTRDSKNPKRSIRMALAGGTVRSLNVTPAVEPSEDRVPITEDSRRGVIDPLSAMLMPVSTSGNPLAPDKCDRTLRIFEGTERFDIALSYSRTENVKSQKGYQGNVLVCRASYRAVAGHRAGKKQVQYMEQNRNIEVWLAPAAGMPVLVPWRISVGTMVGTLVIEATQFTASGTRERTTSAELDEDPVDTGSTK